MSVRSLVNFAVLIVVMFVGLWKQHLL